MKLTASQVKHLDSMIHKLEDAYRNTPTFGDIFIRLERKEMHTLMRIFYIVKEA